MNLLALRHYFRTFSVLVAVTVAASDLYAGVGFQGKLQSPPAVVSAYDDISHTFSAALEPKSFPVFAPWLAYAPIVKSSSFANRTITFSTEIQPGYSLIPNAVDADQFLAYRISTGNDQKLLEAIRKAQFDTQKQGGRTGLSIGVALPKRLDRVFGEGGGNLRVSGYRRISFSGRSQWSDEATSDLYRQSKFPALDMEQTYQFNIEGTIGTKISVKVSEDSQTDIPLANRLILRYKGDDDDIVKAIEAGNTTLDLPNTRFVGYSSTVQGLFGFKAVAQVGHLQLTGIMSQEKGSSERANITATGEDNPTRLRDYQFAENRIFDLADSGTFKPGDKVTKVYVYVSVNENQQGASSMPYANMVVDPAKDTTTKAERGLRVQPIDQQYYRIFNDSLYNRHYIIFIAPQSTSYALGFAMEYHAVDGDSTVRVGNISVAGTKDQPFILKTLRGSPGIYGPQHPAWKLMWRNAYDVPRGLSADQLNVKIFKGIPGTEGTTNAVENQVQAGGGSDGLFITLLGLDQTKSSGQRIPDGKLDDNNRILLTDVGLMVFPSRTPFNSDMTFTDETGKSTVPLLTKVPNIYTYNSPTEQTTGSQYYIQVSSGKSGNATINLNRANIIEGSERVSVNGRQLTRGTDYTIDYSFGRVTLLSLAASDPNANISIDFEYAPFLAIQKKTLMGARAEYQWSQDFRIGSTILYKSDKAQDRKPRVGQETSKMTVLDFDGRFKIYPSFLTKAVNALPLITTEAPSAITIAGEVAQSRPNPNVDGAAYVDDFEAAAEQLSLGMTRTDWTRASKPAHLASVFTWKKMLWHNPFGGVFVDSVYDRQVAAGGGTMSYLRLIFRPDTLSQYPLTTSPTWSGIMTYFGNRVDPVRARLFEIRVKGTHGKIHFDFGKISEDIFGDGNNHNEDGSVNGIANGAVDDSEDVGIDTVPDWREITVVPDSLVAGKLDSIPYNADTNPDPAGDDWYFEGNGKRPVPTSLANSDAFQKAIHDTTSPYYYEWINGTEGNIKDPAVLGRPDQEKLGPSFNTENAYASYSIDLSSDSFHVAGSDLNGWRTYRIPIRDKATRDATFPSGLSDSTLWANITHVRVWFSADDPVAPQDNKPDTVQVAAWYFVQVNWQDTLVLDSSRIHLAGPPESKFRVASVSTEDKTFSPPPGVTAYTDPSTNVTEPQRGMAMIYENLQPGDTGYAVKHLITADSYTGYRRMQMWVHGDTLLTPRDTLMFFYRLGLDSANYYEYRDTLFPGWDTRNEVDIDFNEITALKDAAIRSKKNLTDVIDTVSGHYRIRGRPSIASVVYLASGITNRSGHPIYGQVWLDELRVTDVRRDVGTAARIEVNGNLADLLNYSASYEYRDAYFRGLSSATRGGSTDNLGGGATTNATNYSLSMQLDKFLPRSLGASLPVTFGYSKSISTPLLRTGSDIVLAPDIRQTERSTGESRSFGISESFNRKGKNPIFSLLLNRQSMRFSYGRSLSHSVLTPYAFAENYNIYGEYNMGVSKPPTLPIFFWTKKLPFLKKAYKSRLGLYPTSWRWNGNFNRNLTISDDASFKRTSSLTRMFDGGMNLQYNMFDKLSTTYNYSTRRDFSNPDDVNLKLSNFHFGLETNYTQNFSATYNPAVLSYLTTSFTYTGSYNDTYDRTADSRSGTMSRSWSVGGSFNHMNFFSIGKKGAGTQRSREDEDTETKVLEQQRREAEQKAAKEGKAGADSTAAKTKSAPKAKKPAGPPFYSPLFSVLRFATGWIQPIGYKYSKGYNTSVPGMLERPGAAFRFGFSSNANVPMITDTRPPTASENESIDLNSGFTLLGGFSTDVRYRQAVNRDVISQGDRRKQTQIAWPDLGIKISRFKKFPVIKGLLNKFIDVFAPQTSYSRHISRDYNIDGGYLLDELTSIDRSPLLSVNFKLFRSLSLSGSYSTGSSNDKRYSPTNGELQTETRTFKKSWAVTTRYSFTAPGGIAIPLFGKLKFSSVMTLDLSIRKNVNTGDSRTPGQPFVTNTDKSDFTVTPVIGYQFSQQLKGGLTALWQDTNDNWAKRKSHVRQLQIWAEIRF